MMNKKYLLATIVAGAVSLIPVAANAESAPQTLASNSSILALGHGPIKVKPLKVISRSSSSTILPNTTYAYDLGNSFSMNPWEEKTSSSTYYFSSGQYITYSGTWTPGIDMLSVGLEDAVTGDNYATALGDGYSGTGSVTFQAPASGSGEYYFYVLNSNDNVVYVKSLIATY